MDNDTRTFDEMRLHADCLLCVESQGKIIVGVEYGGQLYYKEKKARPCWQCERKTKWSPLAMGAFICSPTCADAVREEARQARESRGVITSEVL